MMDIIGNDVWDIDEELKKMVGNSTSITGRKEVRRTRRGLM
jgi:hypothetical protein